MFDKLLSKYKDVKVVFKKFYSFFLKMGQTLFTFFQGLSLFFP